ncbi:hypothetical protein AYL99_11757 [Fonsecaea erecta]|uniref:Methyltransferase domain-containing protein n=1 Tax=Fonsecaea erecta TaxID=1367422 RepID=A0A178Z2P9_9EURO|nr:hypothetical protein AYL99_11757 [Fonsecaea erecta]OAP53997.1 hypothetical protein AYL99_11757 [Fonsecaea erecta]
MAFPYPNPNPTLLVDDSDDDSAIGDDVVDSTCSSLSDSVTASLSENGRTYHSYCDGAYLFPNDEEEQQRLDLQHAMFTRLLGSRLYLAPISRPDHVLDLGTGTGIWAIDFADLHPESIVRGVDLSPIQPNWVPPNCSFEIFNYKETWEFNHQFDFVCAREIWTSITSPSNALFQQVWDNLTPGGWFEMQDIVLPRSDDGTIPEGGSYHTWIKDYHTALRAAGRNPDIAEEYEHRLHSVGFTDVHKVVFKLPQNKWPKFKSLKLLGTYQHENTLRGLEAWSLRLFTQYLERPVSAVQEQLEGVEKDIGKTGIHAYWPVVVVYAQKPW